MNQLKQFLYLLIFCSFLTTSCNNDTHQQTQCYFMKANDDSTAIQLIQKQDNILGYYAWEPKESDGVHGVFTGKITENIIHAHFTYIIEGDTQTQEVVFKHENKTLIQGQGELSEKEDGTLVLKTPNQVKWTERFTPINCKKIQTSINNAIQAQKAIQG